MAASDTQRQRREYETQLHALYRPGRAIGPLRRCVLATTPAGHAHVVPLPVAGRHHITRAADGGRWLIVRRWCGTTALRMPVGLWPTSVSEVWRAGGSRFLLPGARHRTPIR